MRTKTLHEHKLDYTKDKCLNPSPIFSHKKTSYHFIFAYACSKKKKSTILIYNYKLGNSMTTMMMLKIETLPNS
jgi:hypothetical protein